MKTIVDTHIFLWALSAPDKISKDRLKLLEQPSNQVFVSSVSIAEIAIKSSLGALKVEFDVVEAIKACGFEELGFYAKDAILLKELPFHHKDPFDRMLIAQSISNRYHLMSDDNKFAMYGCKLI